MPTATPRLIDLAPIRLLVFSLGICGTLVGCAQSDEQKLESVRELQARGELEESIEILTEMIDSGSRDGEVLYRYGRALTLDGRPGLSTWALDAAMDDPEWLIRAGQQLAINSARARNNDLALQVLARLEEERTDPHEDDLESRLLELRVLLNTRRAYATALEQAEAILDDFPDAEEAIRYKAVALLGLKETDEAYETIREAGILASEISDGGEIDEETGPTDEADDAPGEAGGDGEADSEVAASAYWCTVRATFKREAEEPEEASEIIDECLERFPTDIGLISEATKLYSQLGRYARSVEILEKAYEAGGPNESQIRGALVQHLVALGRAEEAETLLRDAVAKLRAEEADEPVREATLMVALSGLLMEHERFADSAEVLDEALALLGEQASPDLLLRHAEALIMAERYDEARVVVDRLPVEVHRSMMKGRVAFEQGDYAGALAELEAAALIWPDNAPIRYYLARAAEGVGQFDTAVEEYRQAIRSDPALAAARERLTRLHLAEGRVRHAATILGFQSPRASSSASTEMRLLEIEVQASLGQEPDLAIRYGHDRPVEELQRDALRALARGLSRAMGPRGAESILAELQKQADPSARGLMMRQRVDLLLSADDPAAAVQLGRDAAQTLPGDIDVELALGRALAMEGSDLDESQRLLEAVLERRPADADALASLGDILRSRNDREAALARYDLALEVEPDHWQAASGAIETLVEAGRREEAVERLRAYVDRASPYDGSAALELARLQPEDPAGRERQLELVRRSIRFGGGAPAIEMLRSVDPDAAAQLDALSPRSATEGQPPAPAESARASTSDTTDTTDTTDASDAEGTASAGADRS